MVTGGYRSKIGRRGKNCGNGIKRNVVRFVLLCVGAHAVCVGLSEKQARVVVLVRIGDTVYITERSIPFGAFNDVSIYETLPGKPAAQATLSIAGSARLLLISWGIGHFLLCRFFSSLSLFVRFIIRDFFSCSV